MRVIMEGVHHTIQPISVVGLKVQALPRPWVQVRPVSHEGVAQRLHIAAKLGGLCAKRLKSDRPVAHLRRNATTGSISAGREKVGA